MTVKIVNGIEFIFTQDGEFKDPYYAVVIGGKIYGDLHYVECQWRGFLSGAYSHTAVTFDLIAEKLDELNESLAQERSKFFGF